MGRRERLQQMLINHVSKANHSYDASEISSVNSYYRESDENMESRILNVKKISDMKLLLERALGNDETAKYLTALIFYDLYITENMISEETSEKSVRDVVEVPAYTYTL